MSNCEDDHLNIRISAKLKQDLKRVLPLYGFNDYSAWVRACAVKIIENNSSDFCETGTECVPKENSLDLDPEIRRKFFAMLNNRFGVIIARYPKKKVMGMYMDFTRAFYEETHIVLLPIEAQMLLRQYYSGSYFTPKVRQAYEDFLRLTYDLDYQTELPQHDSSHQEGEKVL